MQKILIASHHWTEQMPDHPRFGKDLSLISLRPLCDGSLPNLTG